MAVIVAVYSPGGASKSDSGSAAARRPAAEVKQNACSRAALQTVAELTEANVLYPITLRDLLAIISEQQIDGGFRHAATIR